MTIGPRKYARISAAASIALVLPSCAIDRNVRPVESAKIELLCIEQNEAVLMDEFEPTLLRLIGARGISTQTFKGDRPEQCRHVLQYVANWRWDMAMYLYYAKIDVFDGFDKVGSAEYDATMGGLNLDKFGSTEAKIEPLVGQLFPEA